MQALRDEVKQTSLWSRAASIASAPSEATTQTVSSCSCMQKAAVDWTAMDRAQLVVAALLLTERDASLSDDYPLIQRELEGLRSQMDALNSN